MQNRVATKSQIIFTLNRIFFHRWIKINKSKLMHALPFPLSNKISFHKNAFTNATHSSTHKQTHTHIRLHFIDNTIEND